ncbi:GntR family transcriptional regulator [Bacillaceae bacterium]
MRESYERPLYLRVIDQIKRDIENGSLKPGERLPSEFNLAQQFGVSRETLKMALRLLEEENILIRRHGVGTFVRARPIFSSGIEELFSITDMIAQKGFAPATHFLYSGYVDPQEEEMKKLKLSERERVLLIERVRTADGTPVVYCIDKIPQHLLPNGYSWHYESIFDFLEEQANVTVSHAVAQIEALGYHEKISEILQCEPETSLLVLKQLHYDAQERPVLYSINYFRADKFSFQAVRRRTRNRVLQGRAY